MRTVTLGVLTCLIFVACKKDAPLKYYPLNIPELGALWGRNYDSLSHAFPGTFLDSTVNMLFETYRICAADKNAPFKNYTLSLRIGEEKQIVNLDIRTHIEDAKVYADNLLYLDEVMTKSGRLIDLQVANDKNGQDRSGIQTINDMAACIKEGGPNAWMLHYDQYPL